MPRKIKILFQLNELAFGGTTKAVLTFCKFLDKEKFEPFLFYHSTKGSSKYWRRRLLSYVSRKEKNRFDEFYVRSLVRLPEFRAVLGEDHIFCGQFTELLKACDIFTPDIIHFNRGEHQDWYTEKLDQIPSDIRIVETNIFGIEPTQKYLSRLSAVISISHWLNDKSTWAGNKGKPLYFPVLPPQSQENLRDELGIPADALVLGRISRPHLDQGEFVVDIFNELKTPKVHLIVVAASKYIVDASKKNPRIHIVKATTDERRLSRFYNSLDILLHYRKEGETFGLNIAEAMIHGLPCISHKSFMDNAQIELLDGCGLIAEENNISDYKEKLMKLIDEPDFRKKMGKSAKEKALSIFEASVMARKLESFYQELLNH